MWLQKYIQLLLLVKLPIMIKSFVTNLRFVVLVLLFMFHYSDSNSQMWGGLFNENRKYNQDITLYESKRFVIDSIIGRSSSPVYLEIDAIAAAKSGELTTIVYSCDSLKRKGVVFCFWSDFWNKYGTDFKGFKYKRLTNDEAYTLIKMILNEVGKFSKRTYSGMSYMGGLMVDGGETYFDYLGMTILLTGNKEGVSNIRLFWGDFDAEWNIGDVERMKKRLDQKNKKLSY